MNTKVITAIGVGTLALSLGQSSVGAQEKGTVTASVLNIRSGPGVDTSKKGCLYKGDTVAILEKSNGWLKIQLSNKTTGWVSDKYIKIGNDSVNEKVKCNGNLNVRSGPGTSYAIKTTVKNGTIHKITDKSNGWYKIQLSNGTSGWVYGSYIEETMDGISNDSNNSNNNPTKPDDILETEVNLNGKVTSSVNLNVRSGPSTSYSATASLRPGQVVVLISQSNGWYKVKLYNGTTGWVSSSYISKTDTYGESTASLNVRSGPGTNYSIKTTLKRGEIVTITKSSNSWYEIKTNSNITGWVSSKYINITTELPSNNTNNDDISNDTNNDDISKTDTYGKSTANLNVRSGPGTNYSIKTVLKRGEIVTITKSSNSWYQIKTNANITGWVSSKYINITTEPPSNNTNNDDTSNNTNNDNTSSESKNEAVVNLAMAQLGKPYVWGGNGPNSFDCSGFTRYVYLNARGISLPRVSYEQAKSGTAVGTSNLEKGDLLYFATVTPGRTSHVGIYIGNNQFIHASGSQTRPDKVKISSLSGYYGRVLLGARRF